MKQIRLDLGRMTPWARVGHVWSTGASFAGNELKSGEKLCNHFLACQTDEEFLNAVCDLNGFFAAVVWDGHRLFAAVDHIRSLPLFYSETQSTLFLSDDPYWIQEQLGGSQLDPVSTAEFSMTGYVTGPRTLDPRVSQIQAGEALFLKSTESDTLVNLKWHYQFRHHDYISASPDELCEMLDEVTLSSVRRLLSWADGRQIVIPLSGGFDSRLIAMTVRRLGYDNVCAFSYGVQGNLEAELSREVAAELGMRWFFVPYSHDAWKNWHGSSDWSAYSHFAERLVSVPHFQDWPAVMELLRDGRIADDCVVAPGHSADYLAGKQIPPRLLRVVPARKRDREVLASVWQRHYNLRTVDETACSMGLQKGMLLDALEARAREHFVGLDLDGPQGMLSAFDYEFWQEWLAKVIVNSMRVYEYWGCRWWLPWYDTEFVGLWERIPLDQLIHKALYDRYVCEIQRSLGITSDIPQRARAHTRWVRQIATPVGLWPLAETLSWRLYRRRREYCRHFLAWHGIVDYVAFSRLLRRGGSIYTILTAEQSRKHLYRSDAQ